MKYSIDQLIKKYLLKQNNTYIINDSFNQDDFNRDMVNVRSKCICIRKEEKLLLLLSFIDDYDIAISLTNQFIKDGYITRDYDKLSRYKIVPLSLKYNVSLLGNRYRSMRGKQSIFNFINNDGKYTVFESLNGNHKDGQLFPIEKEELYFQSNEDYKDLLYRYYIFGTPVNLSLYNTLDSLYIKYHKNNISFNEFAKKIRNNKNFQNVLKTFAILDEDSFKMYLNRFIKMYSKTRIDDMIDNIILLKSSDYFIDKFDLKIWNTCLNELVMQDTLICELIIFAGLFNDDENQKQRLNKMIELFGEYSVYFYPEEMNNILSSSDKLNEVVEQYDDLKYLDTFKFINYFKMFFDEKSDNFCEPIIKELFVLRDGLNIDSQFSNYLLNGISADYMKKIKKLNGNFGCLINKFISPYSMRDNRYYLKNGVVIPNNLNLKDSYSIDEYNELLNSTDDVVNFINPFKQVSKIAYQIKKEKLDLFDKARMSLLCCNFKGRNNINIENQLFAYIDYKVFDEDIYNFFINNCFLIMKENNCSSIFKEIICSKKNIGNVNINDISLCDDYVYDDKYKNFAIECGKAFVPVSKYKDYEKLYMETEKRTNSTIPRMKKEYDIIINNKKMKLRFEVLETNSSLNLLVGEKAYSDCCQIASGKGEKCMVHAGTSASGGILVCYLNDKMITQSWIWTNERKLCIDNIETTNYLRNFPIQIKDDLVSKLRECYVDVAEEFLSLFKTGVNNYIIDEIGNSANLDNDLLINKLWLLNNVKKRQTFAKVTIGNYGNCYISFDNTIFNKSSKDEATLPKHYVGYSDLNKENTDELILKLVLVQMYLIMMMIMKKYQYIIISN